jgi:hypothetical protein
MKRIAAVVGATLAISLASTGVAHADNKTPPMPMCGGGYIAPPMSTHLQYVSARWDVSADPDDATLGLDAPRGWSFVRTASGEGRFHHKIGDFLLSLRTTTDSASTAAQMSAQVSDLAGTPGLKILGQHTKVVGEQRWSTLSYRYTSMGEPREVSVRWIAFGTDPAAEASLVLTVAGRPLDGKGLNALLSHVTPTVQLAG